MEKDAAFKALYPCGIKKNSVKETVQADEVPQRMYGRRIKLTPHHSPFPFAEAT